MSKRLVFVLEIIVLLIFASALYSPCNNSFHRVYKNKKCKKYSREKRKPIEYVIVLEANNFRSNGWARETEYERIFYYELYFVENRQKKRKM